MFAPQGFGESCAVVGLFDGRIHDICSLEIQKNTDTNTVVGRDSSQGRPVVTSESYELLFTTRVPPDFYPESSGEDFLIDKNHKLTLVGMLYVGSDYNHMDGYTVELLVSDIKLSER